MRQTNKLFKSSQQKVRTNIRWKKLLARTTLWLVAEISLNFIGIDDLADYSEFIFERNLVVQLC